MRRVYWVGVLLVGAYLLGGCGANRHIRYTMVDNPTTRAGRGEPSTDDERRPAAWILVDGKEGEFRTDEQTGIPQIQWFIEKPVSSTPTFRLVVIPELLGENVNANFALQGDNLPSGESVFYGLAGVAGTFQPGTVYSLADPGPAFIVTKQPQKTEVESIGALPPGDYVLAASVEGDAVDKKVLAATRFTVAE
ncbi:MAG: hypothetical protein J5J06_14180 [Phycisphaerae bacterium]|nr:hypothetical protein [Phycisphaerae bacterium]